MDASAARGHPCTIVARNYLPFARVLADSYRAQHPGSGFTVLLIDDHDRRVDDSAEPFEVLRLDALDLTQSEARCRGLLYSVTEFATSVKAVFLRRLLQEHEVVAYFDPDIAFYAPVPDVMDLAVEHGIVLSPHTLAPMRRDGLTPGEADILKAGVYNLGFIAVSRAAKECLDWWAERLARGSFHDPANMMFFDQRWIDFVPGHFPHALLRDPGCNVAYWNLDRRRVRQVGDGFEVDGTPLRFFHFSGYNPRQPWLLSKHQGSRPRVLLSANPALRRLCDDYRGALLAAGYEGESRSEYGFARLGDGAVVDEVVRAAFRAAVAAAETRPPGREHEGAPAPPGSVHPPEPFDPARAHEFEAWLAAPDSDRPQSPLSRYLSTLWALRPDLQRAFPDPHGQHARAFIERAGTCQEPGPSAALVRRSVTESLRRVRVQEHPVSLTPGVNVVGYLRAEFGLGESARCMVRALADAGVAHVAVSKKAGVHRDDDRSCEATLGVAAAPRPGGVESGLNLPHDTTLLCMDVFGIPHAVYWMGAARAGRHVVGMCYWELERVPPSVQPSLDLLDEVWVPTEFVRKSIQAVTEKPVRVVPPPIEVPAVDPNLTRSDFGIPADRFAFLFIFDYCSDLDRKNVMGLVAAYRRTFDPSDGTTLVLKTLNGDALRAKAEQLRFATADRPDILLIDQTMAAVEKNSLIRTCDAYVSLHRSEGFGLTMAEAMALGKPVIATGYSGNRAFMTSDNSFLVPYTMSEVPPGCDPYPAGYRWADPDLRAASTLMWFVRSDPAGAARVAERGRQTILREHSVAARGSGVGKALAASRARRIGSTSYEG